MSSRRIFICYRRGDSGGHAGRLYDSLRRELPDDEIFIDVEGLAPGVDFASEIGIFLQTCDAVLAIFGPKWQRMNRRLRSAPDYVNIELRSALQSSCYIIPILIRGASMPSRLPRALATLSTRQAMELSDHRWDYDLNRLMTSLRDIPQRPGRKSPPEGWTGGEQASWFAGLSAPGTVPEAITGRVSDTFPGQGREAARVCQALVAWLRQQDLEVQDWADDEAHFIQVRTPSGWRRTLAMATHVTIELSQVGDNLITHTYPARWRDRGAKPDYVMLHYYTLAVLPTYGAVQERRLVFKVRKFIADQVGPPEK